MERKISLATVTLVLFSSLAAVQDAIQLALTSPAFVAGGPVAKPQSGFQNITLDEKDVGISTT